MSRITVSATGANITTGAASARVAIPVNASGNIAALVRIASTAAAHIKPGDSAITAAAADLLVQPGDSVKLAIPRGMTHIAAIQDTATGTVTITPLEDC